MNETDASKPMTDRLSRRDLPFIVCALVSGLIVLYLGRSLTFWYDEWRSITFDGGPVDFFRPVNEHWSTLPLLLYRATFNVVELHSYLPYLAQVIVLHLIAVAGAYVLMRRRVGRMAATLLALPLLILGAGAENLFWAFQTGFVGSVVFGVWALVLVERPHPRSAMYASALLVLSVASSGIGPFFAAAVAVRTAVEPAHRARLWVAAPPMLLYATWHVLFGRDALGGQAPLAGPASIVGFWFRGMNHAFEALVGVSRFPTGGVVGFACFVLLCVFIGRRAHRGSWPALACGCVGGLVGMYAVIGVARAGYDVDLATRSRYVYVASFLVVLSCADLIARPISVNLRGRRAIGALGITALLAWIVAANANSLILMRIQFQYNADLTRAFIQLAVESERERWVDPEARFQFSPVASDIPRLLERHGSPLEDSLLPGVVSRPSRRAYESAALLLTGEHFRIERASGHDSFTPVRVTGSGGAVLDRDQAGCLRVRSVDESASVTISVGPGERLRLSSPDPVEAIVLLGYEFPPSRGLHVVLRPGRAQDVLTPDRGRSRPSRLAVALQRKSVPLRVCALRSRAVGTAGAGLPSPSS